MYIKVPADFKIQLRRNSGTFVFTLIYLMYLIIPFYSDNKNKLDDGIPVAHF